MIRSLVSLLFVGTDARIPPELVGCKTPEALYDRILELNSSSIYEEMPPSLRAENFTVDNIRKYFAKKPVYHTEPPAQVVPNMTVAGPADAAVNAGMGVWQIVKDGKPSIHTQQEFVTAIPPGVSLLEMDGWQAADSGTWSWHVTDSIAGTAINVEWGYVWEAHGHSPCGGRRWIANGYPYIKSAYAIWGYGVDVSFAASKPVALSPPWLSTTASAGANCPRTWGDMNGQITMALTINAWCLGQSWLENPVVSIRGDGYWVKGEGPTFGNEEFAVLV
jgi:hypothetical protein